MYSEATAAHPYSQVANIHLGATETGFLLGYIPAEVSYKKIDTKKNQPTIECGFILACYVRTPNENVLSADVAPGRNRKTL